MVTLSVFIRLATLLAALGLTTARDSEPASSSSPLIWDTIRVVPVEFGPFPRPELPLGAITPHPLVSAAAAGFDPDALKRAERAIETELARGGFPGAALAIGRLDNVVLERGVGRLSWNRYEPRVDPEYTVYDLASLTKVVAATTAVMLLVEDGKLNLDDPVSRFLPEYAVGSKRIVTIRHLLTHTSGLPAGATISAPIPAAALARALDVPLRWSPGQRVEYSDVGFIVLWAAAEVAAEEPLFRLVDRRVFGPLGMHSTTFIPGEGCQRCAPTLRRRDGTEIRGRVHDPTAYRLGGVTGNAGLFSTAHDMARFAAMLASGGTLDGVRVLEEETIRTFTRRVPRAGTRALGWDTPSLDGTGAAGLQISSRAFGHTGFTGTSMWIDPDRGSWVVLLSNRTYDPRTANRIQAVRRSIHDWVSLAANSNWSGPVLAR
jgi:serine-type D-Ala-D-Ala carboxypeptidase